MRWRFAFAVLALGMASVPTAQAHAAPDPLDNEIHLLADGGDDTYAYTGALDLQDLFAREAWHRPSDAEGVIFRMIVYGSVSPGGLGGPLRLTLDWGSPGGGGTLALTSPDGLTYTPEGAVLVEASMATEGTAVQGSIQVFVPYDALGAGRGEALDAMVWRSWTGTDLRDIAPGGRPVPGSQGAVMVPEDSTVVTESLALEGPRGYTRSTTTFDAGSLAIDVQNLITTTGQHVVVEVPPTPGWTVGEPEPAGAAVDAAQHPSFAMAARADRGAGPLTVYVTTDLGGREALVVRSAGGAAGETGPTVDAGGQGGGEGPREKDTPVAGGLTLAAVVGVALLASRRFRR